MDFMSSSASAAIAAWRQDLGNDAVIADADDLAAYTQSACGSKRQVVAVLKPGSHDEVEKVVATANTHKVPLYPISCGKQWGMGSKLPVTDGAAIVDLGRMNRIIEVNAQYQYAVVEPGVTQRQLLDYIDTNNLSLMLNVTGSTSDTSLIGNAMDRGVGFFDSRAHGISNMRVVLGNGETIQTGFGHYAGAKTCNLYHHGIGPSLDGLFPQANFGIVTSACIDLMPKPDGHMVAVIKIDSEEKLPQLIDALVQLRSSGVIKTIAHVGNRERSYITLGPLLYDQLVEAGAPADDTTRAEAYRLLEEEGFGPWSTAIGVLGNKAQLKLAKKEIRKAINGFTKAMFLTDQMVKKATAICTALSFIPLVRRQLMLLKAVDPVFGYTRGETTDTSIKAVYWAADDLDSLNKLDPDHSESGILYCLPIIPADGESVLKVVRDTCDTFTRYGFKAAITVNLMDTRALEGVISLAFDRSNQAQVEKAHACIQEMEEHYIKHGYPPYRVGINSMNLVVSKDDSYWHTVRDLKKVLDPNHIIAPGRYNLV